MHKNLSQPLSDKEVSPVAHKTALMWPEVFRHASIGGDIANAIPPLMKAARKASGKSSPFQSYIKVVYYQQSTCKLL